jgi:hypothetical protein
MDEELDQIEKNDTWELVPRPKNKNVIDTKWVFRNKLNEYGQVTRNKARLVCKGYAQIEGIDFEETFASSSSSSVGFSSSSSSSSTYFSSSSSKSCSIDLFSSSFDSGLPVSSIVTLILSTNLFNLRL